MALFKKRCAFCNEKIKTKDAIFESVKVPEFKNPVTRPFCSDEHAELYKKFVKGIPSKSSCPYCLD